MKAVLLTGTGAPEHLVLSDVPDPKPAPGQVLVCVRAAGLNFADVKIRQGVYRRELPLIPGFEIAGDVAAVGTGVTEFRVGERVMGTTPGTGGYAELAVARPFNLAPIPEHLSYDEAAAVPVAFTTAYHALVTFGRVAAGERVLIHAAGGGVGTAAVQLASTLGAQVYATAGSQAKLNRVLALGATCCINYAEQDFAAVVRDATAGEGVDVVLDSIGGKVFTDSLQLLRPLGRMVVYGTHSSEPTLVDPGQLMFKNVSVSAMSILASLLHDPAIAAKALQAVLAYVTARQIQPVVGHRLPLSKVQEGHGLLEGRGSYGKVVFTI